MTVAPAPNPHVPTPGSPRTRRRKLYGLLAEFETPAAIYHAAERVRAEGYRWWDCHTPFPVHGLDKAMGVKPTILPILVFLCGATGMIIGILLQWYTNAMSFEFFAVPGVTIQGYQFMISGKPFASVPAWIPVVFELTVLLASVGCVLLLLLLCGLPRLYHPLFRVPRFARATDDRFFVLIEARDPQFYREKTEQLLQSLDPIAVEEVFD